MTGWLWGAELGDVPHTAAPADPSPGWEGMGGPGRGMQALGSPTLSPQPLLTAER